MQKKIHSPKVLISIISLLVVLICCESISRFFERKYFFNTSVYVQRAKPLLHEISNIPGLGYELIPGAQTENGFFSINSKGIRDTEFSIPKPDNVYRIIILGDSVTFGTGYEVKQTYPKVLEHLLNQRQNTDVRFEVLNAGVCSYNAIQKFLFFKHKLLDYNPDMVILQFLNDDYYRNAVILPGAQDYPKSEVSLSIGEYFAMNMPKVSILPLTFDRMLLRHSAFYRLINKRLYDRKSRRNPRKYIPEAYKFAANINLIDSMQINKQAFAEFSQLSRESGFEFVVLLVPELTNKDQIGSWIKKDAPLVYGFKTIDLFKQFKDLGIDLESLRIIPEGKCHFNQTGHMVTARIIKKWIDKFLSH